MQPFNRLIAFIYLCDIVRRNDAQYNRDDMFRHHEVHYGRNTSIIVILHTLTSIAKN